MLLTDRDRRRLLRRATLAGLGATGVGLATRGPTAMAQQADRGSEDPIHALVDANGVPRFETARPEQIAPTLRALIAQHRALIARLLADPTPPSWERFFAPCIGAMPSCCESTSP